jgi:hypothetical protein
MAADGSWDLTRRLKSLFAHYYDVMNATNVSVIQVSYFSWRGVSTVRVQDALR